MMAFLLRLEQLPFCVWLHESSSIWAFPMFLFMHTLGMSMIAGVSAVIDLVFLGFWPRMPIKPLERLYPLMWAGFWVNAVTGTVLTIADASTRLINPIFYIKMTFVFAGVALLVVMRKRVFGDPELDRAPLSRSAKGLAWASLICWLGAITAGRLLAYLGPVSGLTNITNH
jgi:hypothetical protein